MHYIYCYTNKINGHKYVGQTNNLKRRIREHSSCAFNPKSFSYNHLIHQKIRQYGEKNFDISVLEILYTDNIEEVNEREKYWIKKLESFCGTGKGYNRDAGGCCAARSSVLSEEQLKELRNDLIENKIPFIDLKEKYKVSFSFISSVNHGVLWRDDSLEYPLRKYYKDDKDYDELIDLLLNSDLSYAKIAEALGISQSTVKKINYGTLRHGMYPTYPIRKITPSQRRANLIIELLKTTDLSFDEIAKEVGASRETVRRTNLGETCKKENEKYPIRTCRDYSPSEEK